MINQRLHYLRMDGHRVFKFATQVMADSVRKVVSASGMTVEDIDLIIPHQANDRIIELARRRLQVPPEKIDGQYRPLRQHLCGLHPPRLRRRYRGGPAQARRSRGVRRLWRRPHLGGSRVPLGAPRTGSHPRPGVASTWSAWLAPVAKARTAVWSARISLATKIEPLLLPLYTFAAGYKKRRKKAKKS